MSGQALLSALPELEDPVTAPPALATTAWTRLCCPICKASLTERRGELACTGPHCGTSYPLVDGIPILINDSASVFQIEDFKNRRPTFFPPRGRLLRAARRLFPALDRNLKAAANYQRFGELVHALSPRPKVLVLGGSIVGEGLAPLVNSPALELIETDVALGPRTRLICDIHDIPFHEATFDGVIAQAVLEHVVDPHRAADEIHRVLKPRGIVYAETPFMQQVHAGKYDFTRFTHLGHRRLFRAFEEVDSGAACGPGMALAWAWQYFLLSFTGSMRTRRAVNLFARLSGFWLKYFDRFLIDRPAALDAASGLWFLGRKSTRVLPDRELLTQYRGGFGE